MSTEDEYVRNIVRQEAFYREILDEGLWSDVKSGAKRLINAVTKSIDTSLFAKAKEALASLDSLPNEAKEIVDITRSAMNKTGEKIPLTESLKLAKEVGSLTTQSVGEMLASDLKGPIHSKAKELQSESVGHALVELKVSLNELQNNKNLNEGGILGILGLSLAGFGGLLFLLTGLEKLARFLGADKIASVIHKVHHVLHVIEEKTIDLIIPDRLSYVVYRAIRKRGFTAQSSVNRELSFDEYSSDFEGVRKKTEKLVYAAFLLFLAWNGITAAVNAGISLLGFAEGTASVIKGVEIGQAAAHIADIIELGMEEIDDTN